MLTLRAATGAENGPRASGVSGDEDDKLVKLMSVVMA